MAGIRVVLAVLCVLAVGVVAQHYESQTLFQSQLDMNDATAFKDSIDVHANPIEKISWVVVNTIVVSVSIRYRGLGGVVVHGNATAPAGERVLAICELEPNVDVLGDYITKFEVAKGSSGDYVKAMRAITASGETSKCTCVADETLFDSCASWQVTTPGINAVTVESEGQAFASFGGALNTQGAYPNIMTGWTFQFQHRPTWSVFSEASSSSSTGTSSSAEPVASSSTGVTPVVVSSSSSSSTAGRRSSSTGAKLNASGRRAEVGVAAVVLAVVAAVVFGQ